MASIRRKALRERALAFGGAVRRLELGGAATGMVAADVDRGAQDRINAETRASGFGLEGCQGRGVRLPGDSRGQRWRDPAPNGCRREGA